MMAAGHEVRLASGGTDAWPEAPKAPFEIEPITVDRWRFNPLADWKLARELWRLIDRHRPDLVHGFTMKPNLMAVLIMALRRLTGRHAPRLVMTFPGLGRLFDRQAGLPIAMARHITCFLFAAAGGVVKPHVTCERQSDATALVEAGVASPDRLSITSGSGVDFALFSPGEHTGPLTVLYAGRLLKMKGAQWFVDAARRFASDRVCFVLAGSVEAQDEDCLEERDIDSAVRSGALTYLGKVEPGDMPQLLRRSDILCLPTLYGEGLPRIVTEATACGCAVLTTAGGNGGGIVRDGETGRLLDHPTPESFMAVLGEMIANPEATRRMGAEAAIRVRDLGLSEDEVIDQFAAIYTQAINDEALDRR